VGLAKKLWIHGKFGCRQYLTKWNQPLLKHIGNVTSMQLTLEKAGLPLVLLYKLFWPIFDWLIKIVCTLLSYVTDLSANIWQDCILHVCMADITWYTSVFA
jgi:hypothetical protein